MKLTLKQGDKEVPIEPAVPDGCVYDLYTWFNDEENRIMLALVDYLKINVPEAAISLAIIAAWAQEMHNHVHELEDRIAEMEGQLEVSERRAETLSWVAEAKNDDQKKGTAK